MHFIFIHGLLMALFIWCFVTKFNQDSVIDFTHCCFQCQIVILLCSLLKENEEMEKKELFFWSFWFNVQDWLALYFSSMLCATMTTHRVWSHYLLIEFKWKINEIGFRECAVFFIFTAQIDTSECCVDFQCFTQRCRTLISNPIACFIKCTVSYYDSHLWFPWSKKPTHESECSQWCVYHQCIT